MLTCVQTEEEGYIGYLPLSLSVVLLKAGSLREAGPYYLLIQHGWLARELQGSTSEERLDSPLRSLYSAFGHLPFF